MLTHHLLAFLGEEFTRHHQIGAKSPVNKAQSMRDGQKAQSIKQAQRARAKGMVKRPGQKTRAKGVAKDMGIQAFFSPW